MIPGLVDVKKDYRSASGSMVLLARNLDIHYVTPVQYPADDASSGIITTHFDYHSINDRLVKLDILGHDDPTVIKMLETMLNIDIKTIPIGDPETMSLFQNTKALGGNAGRNWQWGWDFWYPGMWDTICKADDLRCTT